MYAYVKIYDLRDQVERLRELEKSALRWRSGEPAHGEIGSERWWGAIASGQLPGFTEELIVIRSQMTDNPRMGGDPLLEYVVEKDGAEDFWFPPDESLALVGGDHLQLKKVRDPVWTDLLVEIWKRLA